MKIQEMLDRKGKCSNSFDEQGEGLNCSECGLCEVIELEVQTLEDSHGEGIEGAQIKLFVNPCTLLNEVAEGIKLT